MTRPHQRHKIWDPCGYGGLILGPPLNLCNGVAVRGFGYNQICQPIKCSITMIMYTQGATLDSGSTPDKPDVVSVPDVQESGTETKPDASSNNHLQFSYSVIHCYLSKSYPANLCKVPQNPLGPQNTSWQPQGSLNLRWP